MVSVMISLHTAVMLLALLGIGLNLLFLRWLQLRCPDEWERLGSPSIIVQDMSTGWRLTKYILGGHFRHLDEASVVRLGKLVRVFDWLWTLGWAAYVGLVLFVGIPLWLHWI